MDYCCKKNCSDKTDFFYVNFFDTIVHIIFRRSNGEATISLCNWTHVCVPFKRDRWERKWRNLGLRSLAHFNVQPKSSPATLFIKALLLLLFHLQSQLLVLGSYLTIPSRTSPAKKIPPIVNPLPWGEPLPWDSSTSATSCESGRYRRVISQIGWLEESYSRSFPPYTFLCNTERGRSHICFFYRPFLFRFALSLSPQVHLRRRAKRQPIDGRRHCVSGQCCLDLEKSHPLVATGASRPTKRHPLAQVRLSRFVPITKFASANKLRDIFREKNDCNMGQTTFPKTGEFSETFLSAVTVTIVR